MDDERLSLNRLVKNEWWIEDSLLHSGVLAWARLRVWEDGRAEILSAWEKTFHFPSEEEADIWLTSDEYLPFRFYIEDGDLDDRIKPPVGETDDELMPQMQVEESRVLANGPTWQLVAAPVVAGSIPTLVHIFDWTLYPRLKVADAFWRNWPQYLAGDYREYLTEDQLDVAEQLIQEIRDVAPDVETLNRIFNQARA